MRSGWRAVRSRASRAKPPSSSGVSVKVSLCSAKSRATRSFSSGVSSAEGGSSSSEQRLVLDLELEGVDLRFGGEPGVGPGVEAERRHLARAGWRPAGGRTSSRPSTSALRTAQGAEAEREAQAEREPGASEVSPVARPPPPQRQHDGRPPARTSGVSGRK